MSTLIFLTLIPSLTDLTCLPSGLTTQYMNSTRRINNFVKAVEAAADVKKENLAIERKLAEDSSVTEEEREQTRQTWCKYLKVSIPWIVFILIMVVIGYFIISSNV